MAEAGLQEVETYASRRQNAVAQYTGKKAEARAKGDNAVLGTGGFGFGGDEDGGPGGGSGGGGGGDRQDGDCDG